jgi:hypothetical protein
MPDHRRGDLPPALVAPERLAELRVRGVEDRRHFATRQPGVLVAALLHGADFIEEAEADAGALPFRHRHQAARPALGDLTLIHRDRDMHGQFAIDGADIVRGADHAGQFQIVMRLKQRPETAVCLPDFEIKLRSPK